MNTFTSKDGTSITYQRSGSGPALLLVHGGIADHTRWASILPALEQHFTVYTLDRRGRGGSGDMLPYAIEREFEDIACAVDLVGESVGVLGHSFGALCSLEAARLTANVRRLILYEPPLPGLGSLPAEVKIRAHELLEAGDREGVVTTFMREIVRMPPRELEMLMAAPSWAGRVAAAPTIFREIEAVENSPAFEPARWKSFRIPTLLLLGGESPAYAKASTETLHAALPNSRIAVMPGQQHIAMNTAPELFLKEVIGFLTEADQARRS